MALFGYLAPVNACESCMTGVLHFPAIKLIDKPRRTPELPPNFLDPGSPEIGPVKIECEFRQQPSLSGSKKLWQRQ